MCQGPCDKALNINHWRCYSLALADGKSPFLEACNRSSAEAVKVVAFNLNVCNLQTVSCKLEPVILTLYKMFQRPALKALIHSPPKVILEG